MTKMLTTTYDSAGPHYEIVGEKRLNKKYFNKQVKLNISLKNNPKLYVSNDTKDTNENIYNDYKDPSTIEYYPSTITNPSNCVKSPDRYRLDPTGQRG